MTSKTAREGRQRDAAGRMARVEADVEALKSMPITSLRALWAERTDNETPPMRSRGVLVRMLAWDMQAKALRGLDAKTEEKLMAIARSHDGGRTYAPTIKRQASAGAVLTREWRGTVHTAVITTSGVECEGKIYRSLSDVARAITGTRWSGPRFFGLEQLQKKGQSGPKAKVITA